MGKKEPIPWVFRFSDGPKQGPGRWGRVLFGRTWDALRRGLKTLMTPAGASLLVFTTALVTGYLLYPMVFGPFDRRAPLAEKIAAPLPTGSVAAPVPEESRDRKAPTAGQTGGGNSTPGAEAPARAGSPPAVRPVLDLASLGQPVEGRILGGPGWRKDPAYGDWRYHGGFDLDSAVDAEVRSVWAGAVAEVREVPGGCLAQDRAIEVALTHAGGWETRYRASGAPLVGSGDQVENGTPLIRGASPLRVHFDLLKDGEHVNPPWAQGTGKTR